MPLRPRQIRTTDRRNDLQKIFSAHIADGTLDAGIDYFRSIVVQTPNHSLAWLLLGRLREAQGDYERAYAAFHESALAMQRNVRLPVEAKVSRLVELTKFCLQHGWPDRARLSLNAVFVLNPNEPEALHLRAQIDRMSQAGRVERSTSSELEGKPIAKEPPRPIPVAAIGKPQVPVQPSAPEDRRRSNDSTDLPISTDTVPELKRANTAFTQGDLEQAEKLFLDS